MRVCALSVHAADPGAAPQHDLAYMSPYTRLNKDYKEFREGTMVIHDSFQISSVMVAFLCFGLVLIGGLLVMMRLRHNYQPNLIGALIGAMLCFVLLEALPALT
jgi:hypothetical protein